MCAAFWLSKDKRQHKGQQNNSWTGRPYLERASEKKKKIRTVACWLTDPRTTCPALHPCLRDRWALPECLSTTDFLFITAVGEPLCQNNMANWQRLNKLCGCTGARSTCTCYIALSINHTWGLWLPQSHRSAPHLSLASRLYDSRLFLC